MFCVRIFLMGGGVWWWSVINFLGTVFGEKVGSDRGKKWLGIERERKIKVIDIRVGSGEIFFEGLLEGFKRDCLDL